MNENITFRKATEMYATGLFMLLTSAELQPLLEQIDISMEDWKLIARYLLKTSQQLIPTFPSEVKLGELTENIVAFSEQLQNERRLL